MKQKKNNNMINPLSLENTVFPLFGQEKSKDDNFLIDFTIKDKITYTPIKKVKNMNITKGRKEIDDFYKSKCK